MDDGDRANGSQHDCRSVSSGRRTASCTSRGPQSGVNPTLWHVGIKPNGAPAGAKNAIVTGFKSLSNPDLVLAADGSLRVFFGGLSTPANSALNTATAPATGATWSLQAGKAAQDTTAYASPSGAGTTKDGTPVSAWATTFGTRAHFGTSPADADVAVQTQTQCCGYYPDVATADTAGRAVIGWYSNANGAEGLATQEIAATGPVGPKLFAPGTAGLRKTLSIDQRFAITHDRAAACTSATPPATRRPLTSTSGSTGQKRPRSRSRRRARRT